MDQISPPKRRLAEDLGNGAGDDPVYRQVRDAISAQAMPPGTRLREDEMRAIFGVSRARIRKVFAQLAYAGLVTIEPNKGASVYRPTPQEARDIFAARRGIESTIVKMLAQSVTGADLMHLSRHIEAEVAAEAKRDSMEMVQLSGEFHLRLAEISGNAILLRFLRELITREALVILVYEKPGKPSCSHYEHQKILDAIGTRDPAKAVMLMDEHLGNIEERLDLDRDARREIDLKKLFGELSRSQE
jgi:DNA-binding GntR family transcriptional regulator